MQNTKRKPSIKENLIVIAISAAIVASGVGGYISLYENGKSKRFLSDHTLYQNPTIYLDKKTKEHMVDSTMVSYFNGRYSAEADSSLKNAFVYGKIDSNSTVSRSELERLSEEGIYIRNQLKNKWRIRD